MTRLETLQKDIYELKQLLTVENLRAYKHDCLMDDIDKSLTELERSLGVTSR